MLNHLLIAKKRLKSTLIIVLTTKEIMSKLKENKFGKKVW